ADAHLAETDRLSVGHAGHRRASRRERGLELLRRHGGLHGKVSGPTPDLRADETEGLAEVVVDSDVHDGYGDTMLPREGADGPSASEVLIDHLPRDLAAVGAHPLLRQAVIAGEEQESRRDTARLRYPLERRQL